VDWLVEAVRDGQPMMQAGMFLIPRKLAERTGPWNEQLTLIDDFEYFCRLFCEAEEILFVPGTTLFYRSGMGGSLSARKSSQARESECTSILLGVEHILKKRDDAEAKMACANLCQDRIYDFYPEHKHLQKKMLKKVKELGGSLIRPTGGRYFNLLWPLIGWKAARRLQRLAGR